VEQGRRGWRLIADECRNRRLGILLGVLAGLAWTAGKVSVGLLVQQAVDEGIEADDMASLRSWTIAIAGAALVVGCFTGIRRYLAFREARWIEASLREQLFAHFQRLHFAFHDRAQTGELMSRANTDLQQIQAFVVMIPLTISNAVTVLSVAVILCTIDPVLTLLALGSLPFLNVLSTRFSHRLHPSVMGIQRESADIAAVVEETVAGVRVVKGFGAEPVQAARLRVEADQLYEVSMEAARVRAVFLPALELLPSIGLIATLGYGGHQVLDGSLTLGQLVAFNVYVVMLIWPLRMLGNIIAQSQRAAASGDRVGEVLDTAPAVADGDAALPASAPGATDRGALRFEAVRFAYAPELPVVLDGFDLVVPPGQSIALVGATGSGKTTVARLIPRFYDVQAGAVRLDGVDVRALRLAELRKAIGIVFEETFLFSDAIGANIAFADPNATAAQIERAARLAGAHEFIEALPDGYATDIGERGYSLSGGQRQRIAIARAILADPRVLILDDATSSVDPTKEHEIRDALAEVMRDRTTIVIAHRPATIALADRVVLIGDGRIVADGTHEELLRTSPAYREVLAAAERRAVGHDGDVTAPAEVR
jgi:ATP-binding cassette subfamily B protein